MPTRSEFIAAVRALEGTPYRWGGKSPRTGLDCSGLVTWALKAIGGPDLRIYHGSERLWLELDEVTEPEAGDLAFYGSAGRPVHVVVCLGGPHDRIIGANGGDRTTIDWQRAEVQRARVQYASSPAYRTRLMGYRSLRKHLVPRD
jgi:murein DD-endopeptidase